jgi:hypothetical protein
VVLGQGEGKVHTHGGNIQAVTAPDGLPLRVFEVEPGEQAARITRATATSQVPPVAAIWPGNLQFRGGPHQRGRPAIDHSTAAHGTRL